MMHEICSLMYEICSLMCEICSLMHEISSLMCEICCLVCEICSLMHEMCSLMCEVCSLMCEICFLMCAMCLLMHEMSSMMCKTCSLMMCEIVHWSMKSMKVPGNVSADLHHFLIMPVEYNSLLYWNERLIILVKRAHLFSQILNFATMFKLSRHIFYTTLDLPCLLSGSRIGLIDPHEKYFNKSCYSIKLQNNR